MVMAGEFSRGRSHSAVAFSHPTVTLRMNENGARFMSPRAGKFGSKMRYALRRSADIPLPLDEAVGLGLGHIVALYYCPSTLHRIANIFGTSISETIM
jgi:hypothetical protein